MLRVGVRVVRPLGLRPSALTRRSQWFSPLRANAASAAQRGFADAKKSEASDQVVLPGSSTRGDAGTGPIQQPPGTVKNVSAGSTSPATPSSSTEIPSHNVPLTPPSPPGGKQQTAPPTSIPNPNVGSTSSTSPPPPPPPSPPPKRKPRRFRRFLMYMTLLSAFGYGGSVYYSLHNDNFHDFFTEYVPFGEEAVLYFEERQFRQKFPPSERRTYGTAGKPRDTGNKVTIPSKSGMSWKIADQGDSQGNTQRASPKSVGEQGRQDGKTGAGEARLHPSEATGQEKVRTVETAKKDSPKPEPPKPSPPPAKKEDKPEPKSAPIVAIDPINMEHADEPVVQDLVKILNNIITAVNADNTAGRFSGVVNSAKSELAKVGDKINDLKNAQKHAAEDKIKSSHQEFDQAAKQLVSRLENEMRDQESRWKDEFESEREKISNSYQNRLKTELERAKEVSDQTMKNHLLEQAIEMKRKFLSDVKDRVEGERNNRLGKLSELSESVSELEKLTADWNTVVDTNLKTQHLQVAVDSVRSQLENPDQPRPFVRELAALKETASDDKVVSAAIGSMNPAAYQRGVHTSAQLVDRFRVVADEVRKASLLPEDAGVASHAASFVLSKFLFKKQGLAKGDDVESILTRTETFLEEGDFDAAAREMNGLNGWAKTLSKDWLGEVRSVLEVQQALDVITTEARLQSLRVE
ncbi:MAG: Formation of crista junctions protein 1 [Chaenotheca gracillima]|nr:MAG: Formation of crista junctions protein 1 [Chaenotheca gracillima]